MTQEVKIVKGNLEGNVLQNAASEYTLNELLKVMKAMERTGTNSKKAAREQEKHTDEVRKNAKATKDLTDAKLTYKDVISWLTGRGFRLLTQGIGSFASNLGSAAESIVTFGTNIIATQPEITDFTGALADSRLNVLGLGTIVHQLTQLLMTNYKSFQTLSQSGILLGNRIESLQSDFAAMGVDASTLTSVLAENAPLFAMYGASSSAVSRSLDGMRRGIGETRQELLSYGISLEEQTEIFTSMYARNTRALRDGLVTTDQINQESARYAKSLRTISELTGTSARELQEQQDRLNQEQALQSKLDQLRAEGRINEANQMEEYIRYMESSLGQGGRDLAIAQVMGTTATTEAAISLQGYMNNVNDFARDMYQASIDTPDAEQFRSLFVSAANQLSQAQTLSNDLTTAQALIFAGEGDVVNAILRFTRVFGGSIDNAESNLGNLDESGQTIGSFTDLLVEFRSAIADISATFFANETVQRGLVSFRTWLNSFTTEAEEFDLTAFWEKYNPFNEEGRQNLLDSFRNFWQGDTGRLLVNSVTDFFSMLFDEMLIAISSVVPLYDATEARIRQLERRVQAGQELTPEQEEIRQQQVNTALGLGRTEDLERFSPEETRESDEIRFAEQRIDALLSDIEGAGWMARQANVPQLRTQAIQQLMERLDLSSTDLNPELIERLNNANIETRRIGTLRATGMRSEPRDTVAQIHQGERVLNPEETQNYNNQNQSSMIEKLDQLNNTMMTVASLISQELSIQTRTMNSIGGLGPDLMKGMP